MVEFLYKAAGLGYATGLGSCSEAYFGGSGLGTIGDKTSAFEFLIVSSCSSSSSSITLIDTGGLIGETGSF